MSDRPHVPDWPPQADFLEILCLVFALNIFDHIRVWLKSDKSNSSGRRVCLLLLIVDGPYNSHTAFYARYAEEELFVIEAGLREVRTGAEETGEHRALRTIDCKRRMSTICCASPDLRYLDDCN